MTDTITTTRPFYEESFFSRDTLYRPELPARSSGVAGDVPSAWLHGDDVTTTVLIACFMLAVVMFSRVRGFMSRQLRSFRYVLSTTSGIIDTPSENRAQLVLVVLTCVFLGVLYYFHVVTSVGDTFVLDTPHGVIAIFVGIVMAYVVLKVLLYMLVGSIFFDRKRNVQWLHAYVFLLLLLCLFIMPAVFVMEFGVFPAYYVEIYFAFVLFLVKMMTIYRCDAIFFRQSVVRLQIILYLCALELIPLLALWAILSMVAQSLIINY